MKKIIGIWAQTENGIIGKDQVMPWHLPAELQHFKETTMGQAILMGRVTFDGMNKRVLPGRTSIILTQDQAYDAENDAVLVMHSKEEVLDWFQNQEKNLYIIGGSQILRLFSDQLEEVIQTMIHADMDGDILAPTFEENRYERVRQVHHPKDEKNPYDFTVTYYKRKDLD